MRKQIQIISRCFSQIKHQDDLIKLEKHGIETVPYEFEQFKFGIERANLIHGYTMEEMYGRFYGLKHSPEIKKQLIKDNFVAAFIIGLGFGISLLYQKQSSLDERNWRNYFYADLPVVRQNLQ
ncbi:hypothetical protein pb186bvf_020584 [Paramecium bursaria]